MTFDYLNHRNGRTESLILSPEALIERMIEHIPDKHFKIIRYLAIFAHPPKWSNLMSITITYAMSNATTSFAFY